MFVFHSSALSSRGLEGEWGKVSGVVYIVLQCKLCSGKVGNDKLYFRPVAYLQCTVAFACNVQALGKFENGLKKKQIS